MGTLNNESGAASGAASTSARHSAGASLSPRSPAPKLQQQRGSGGPSTTPSTTRAQRNHLQGHTHVLKLLALFVVVAAMTQLLGIDSVLRRTLQSHCTAFLQLDGGVHHGSDGSSSGSDGSSSDAFRGSGGSTPRVWQGKGLWEQLCGREAAATVGSSATALIDISISTGRSSSILGGGDDNIGSSRSSSAISSSLFLTGEASAAVAAASSYHPAEWPRVYGGQAEPHKRILKRCTGSLFAPPLGRGSRPSRGVVAVWLPARFDLAFCDPAGNSATLRIRPAADSTAAGAAAATGPSTLTSSSSKISGNSSSSNTSSRGGGFQILLSTAAVAAADLKEGPSLSPPPLQQPLQHHTIDLATSRALVADGGSVRIAWSLEPGSREGPLHPHPLPPGPVLLADGVVGQLVGPVGPGAAARPCPGAPSARCLELGVPGAGAGSGLTGVGGGGGGGGGGAAGRRALLGSGSGGGAVAGSVRKAAAATAGTEEGAEEEEGVAEVLAVAATLVLAAVEDRLVLLPLEEGADVAAAARSAVALVRSPDVFIRRLDAAVVSSYEALRTVPYAIGLPPTAPAEDKRLSRKLYDIMLVNTAPGWSTPDRSPHGWQWLWDSCFHALGMNPVNHTAAWEQLKGMLRCQQPDGFVPHICGAGGGGGDADGGERSREEGGGGRGGGGGGGGEAAGASHGWGDTGSGGGGGATGPRSVRNANGHTRSLSSSSPSASPSSPSSAAPPSHLTQPPLLAWAVWDNFLFARDRRRLEWALPRIEGLLEWLARHRSRDGGLTYFYVHGFESGMDNSPRFDPAASATYGGTGTGRSASTAARLLGRVLGVLGGAARWWWGDPRVGTCELCSPHLLSVDLTALVAREMRLVAAMMRELGGRKEEAERWANRSRQVAAALTAYAWSPEQRMYGDVVHNGFFSGGSGGGLLSGLLRPLFGRGKMATAASTAGEAAATEAAVTAPPPAWRRRGVVSPLVTAAGLLALLAGPLPPEHLDGLLSHLKDPASFAAPVPLPTVAISSMHSTRTPGGSSSSSSSSSSSDPTSPSSPSARTPHPPPHLDMWRGPMWVNINYMVAVGLREQPGTGIAAAGAEGADGGRAGGGRAGRLPGEQGGCRECERLASWIMRSTIEEVRKWYDGGDKEGDEPVGSSQHHLHPHTHHKKHHSQHKKQHKKHHHNHHHKKQHADADAASGRGAAASDAAAAARGTVFEFYDTYGEVPPTSLSRKGMAGLGGVRDYHWTAALTLRMMAEEAAAAAFSHTGRGDGGGAGLPEWVPSARGQQ